MENLFMFLATSLVLRVTTPRFKRFIVSPGCSALLNSGNKTLHLRHTKDGDKLIFNSYSADGVRYGLICVQLRQSCGMDKAEKILVNFINRVRKPLHIRYNTAMDVEDNGSFISITDYWQDEAGLDWKIKGYTNGKTLALLYVRNINDTAVKSHDAFLNGFRFSAAR